MPGSARAAVPHSEKPVFVAESGRRARVLRIAARSAAAVTGAWLIALALGAFGLGRLPAVPLPPIGALHEHAGGNPDAVSSKARSDEHEVGLSPASVSGASAQSAVPARPHGKRGQGPPSRTPGSFAVPQSGQAAAGTSPAASTVAPTSTTSTGSGHAPSQTRSGNVVPAGTTGAGSANRPFLDPPVRGR